MLKWNLAEEYAKHFQIPDQAAVESGWQFRERVARRLQEMEKPLLAHEVLFNQHMSGDPLARVELHSGYDEAFISRIAQLTEAMFQHERKQQRHWKRYLRFLCIPRF